MKRWAIFTIKWTILVLLLWQWLFEGVEGAGRVFSFLAGIFMVIGLLSLFFSDKDVLEANKESPLLPTWMSTTNDMAIVLALVWFGHCWGTALMWLVAFVTIRATFERARKLREAS